MFDSQQKATYLMLGTSYGVMDNGKSYQTVWAYSPFTRHNDGDNGAGVLPKQLSGKYETVEQFSLKNPMPCIVRSSIVNQGLKKPDFIDGEIERIEACDGLFDEFMLHMVREPEKFSKAFGAFLENYSKAK